MNRRSQTSSAAFHNAKLPRWSGAVLCSKSREAVPRKCTLLFLVAAAGSIIDPAAALAHGIVGNRFFPATLVTEDPFVADELSFPTISSRRMPATGDEPATRETTFAVDVSKRITENFGISIGSQYKRLKPDEGEAVHGFDNLAAGLKYKFYQNNEHETIISAGIDWDIGNTGAKRIGAESFSTVTPSVFFGKGFGDLPADLPFLRPLAVTGQVGVSIPSRSRSTTVTDDGDTNVERHPHFLQWGVAFQYSLPYLQAQVKDVGLGAPFNRMIPVIELAMSTGLDRGASGTTGTVNPGIIWAGTYVQLAVEAVIPVNNRSGNRTGWIAQLHFFLDDLFPKSIGQPLLGSGPR